MKISEASFSIRQSLSFIIPALCCLYAQNPVSAQGVSSTGDLPTAAGWATKTVQSGSQGGIPALNIIPPASRPPLLPPPETPQKGQAIGLHADIQPSMPQAWRMKALQLFKSDNSLDKNSTLAVRMSFSYANTFRAIAKALANSGLNLDALSFSSGHILLSCQNERGSSDKAIIALRQAAPDSDSSASAGTDVRVFCDSRNHALTLVQIKALLTQVESSLDSNKRRTGAESL